MQGRKNEMALLPAQCKAVSGQGSSAACDAAFLPWKFSGLSGPCPLCHAESCPSPRIHLLPKPLVALFLSVWSNIHTDPHQSARRCSVLRLPCPALGLLSSKAKGTQVSSDILGRIFQRGSFLPACGSQRWLIKPGELARTQAF